MTDWTAFPHGSIESLAENVRHVTGSLPNLPIPRHMTVVRADDGRLLVHSAVVLREEEQRALEAWGEPSWLFVPGPFHRLDAPHYLARYPSMKVYCPKGARAAVEKRVRVDGTYDDFPSVPGIRLLHLRGVRDREGVIEVRSKDGVTLVFNDVLFDLPHLPGFKGWALKVVGSTGSPRVTFIARTALVDDKPALAAHYRELAETPDLVRAIPGHGKPITGDVPAVLRSVADRLSPAR